MALVPFPYILAHEATLAALFSLSLFSGLQVWGLPFSSAAKAGKNREWSKTWEIAN